MGEIAFCQLPSIDKCDSTIQECLIDIQSDNETRAIFRAHGKSDFWINWRAVSVFQNFGENWSSYHCILFFTVFCKTYFVEQGFCQVLHTCKKHDNRLDMNKTGGTPCTLKLTNLQTALKKLADKHHKVRINWNQLFLETNNIYFINAFAFIYCLRFIFMLSRFPVYISLTLKLFSKQNNVFRQRKEYRKRAIFKRSSRRVATVQKRLKTTGLNLSFGLSEVVRASLMTR